MTRPVTVLGAGSWGTALAVHLARVGHRVHLWARDAALADELRRRHANAVYLPDIVFPPGILPVSALDEALAPSNLVVLAVPSHGMREVVRRSRPHIAAGALVVSATKGLEEGTRRRMSELLAEELGAGHPIVALSGPSFAAELARQQPTAVCVASADAAAVARVQGEFRAKYLRLYASRDVVGVEIGGALKNVIAIAAGVVEGLGIGQNALAALITRGLAEIGRLATALGAERETLSGLSGLGDLVLTCTGSLSRNRHVGIELARGRPLPEIVEGMKMVAEGIRTTGAALTLGRDVGVELPITAQMADVLSGRRHAHAALDALMLRRQRAESDAG